MGNDQSKLANFKIVKTLFSKSADSYTMNIYEAIPNSNKTQKVIIKSFKTKNANLIKHVLQEAQSGYYATIDTPHFLVKIHSTFTDEAEEGYYNFCIVMEYCGGGTL